MARPRAVVEELPPCRGCKREPARYRWSRPSGGFLEACGICASKAPNGERLLQAAVVLFTADELDEAGLEAVST